VSIAFDAYTNFAGTGNPVAGSHAGASSGVKSALVLIQGLSSTDEVTSITYGGVAMGEVNGSPVLHLTGELGSAHGFFLGSSVPQGTQTVSVTRTGTSSLKVHVFTATGSADTVVSDTDTLNSDSLANPALSLVTPSGVSTFVAATLFSGQDDPLNVTPDAAYTQVNEFDYGTKVGNTVRRTAIATGGLVTCQWTAAAEDAVAIGVAIQEVQPAAGGLIVGPIPIVGSTSGGGTSGLLVPSSGCWFGAIPSFESLTTYEGRVGRAVEDQVFHQWGDVFPSTAEKDLCDIGGRIVMFNWKMGVGWAAVASGAQDSVIDACAARFATWGKKCFVAPHHEPENENPASIGTPANYRAAYRRIVERFRAAGATNVIWVWKMIGGQFQQYGTAAYDPSGTGDSFWPGDDIVDWPAYDPYNNYGCTNSTWHTFEERADQSLIGNFSFYDHTGTYWPDKPLMIGETGTNEHDALSPTKATWFTEMALSIEGNLSRIKAMFYFHAGPPTFCERYIHTSPEAEAAMAAVGARAHFNPTRPTF
jgi:hypothetical protein